MSLSLAYAANRNGLDVQDFRGGKSCDYFSQILKNKLRGWIGNKAIASEINNSDPKAFDALKAHMKKDKEYILLFAQHAAVVRLNGKKFEYLELQSAFTNGFTQKPKRDILKRFGARLREGIKYRQSYLLDMDGVTADPEFKRLMGYINTKSDQQVKGEGGGEK